MKNSVRSWVLVVSAYLTQIPILIYFISAMINENVTESDAFVGIIVALTCVLALITLILCVINIATAVCRYKKDTPSPYKTTMTVKLSMIPFYIVNFVIWGLFVAVCLIIPYFIAFGILLLVISVISTYIIVLATGADNIVYSFKEFRRTNALYYIVLLVCHFIFCIDLVAAVLLYIKDKPAPQPV